MKYSSTLFDDKTDNLKSAQYRKYDKIIATKIKARSNVGENPLC